MSKQTDGLKHMILQRGISLLYYHPVFSAVEVFFRSAVGLVLGRNGHFWGAVGCVQLDGCLWGPDFGALGHDRSSKMSPVSKETPVDEAVPRRHRE